MSETRVDRQGDTWLITWPEHQVGMGIDHVRDASDGIKAEVTIESKLAGRVIGPVVLNLLSTRSQSELANRCYKRVTALSADVWDGLLVYACAVVAKQYRAPTPTLDLSIDVLDRGPIDYLIPELVPEAETTVVFGDGGSVKSLLCLQVALCVALGRELPWGATPTQTGVLYLDWETNARTVASRLERLALGEACATPSVYYKQCFRPLVDELPDIREQIDRRHIGLVIVDSVGFAAAGALVEDETARSTMNGLRQLSPATRLVVAHVSKASADGTGPAKPFGSQFFWNGMRSGIEVRRSTEQPTDRVVDLGIYHRKSNDGLQVRPFGLSAIFDGPVGGIQFVTNNLSDVPDLAARTSISSRIRDMLRNGSRTTPEMAEELSENEDTVRKTLGRMPDVLRLENGGGRGKSTVWGLSV